MRIRIRIYSTGLFICVVYTRYPTRDQRGPVRVPRGVGRPDQVHEAGGGQHEAGAGPVQGGGRLRTVRLRSGCRHTAAPQQVRG
jgi:hypothetical protein